MAMAEKENVFCGKKKDVGCGGTVFVAANCEEMRESLMATGPKDCQ